MQDEMIFHGTTAVHTEVEVLKALFYCMLSAGSCSGSNVLQQYQYGTVA